MYGTIAQEVTFKALLTLIPEKDAVRLLTNGRERFTGVKSTIAAGKPADLTLFLRKEVLFTLKKIFFQNQRIPLSWANACKEPFTESLQTINGSKPNKPQ